MYLTDAILAVAPSTTFAPLADLRDVFVQRPDEDHVVLSVPAHGGGAGDAAYTPAVQTLLAAVPVSAIVDAFPVPPGREWWLVSRAAL